MKLLQKYKILSLDKLTYIAGILLPIITIPQAWHVVVDKQTAGVSLITWTFYFFASLLFAIYGVIHKVKLLMLTYIPFTIIEAVIVVGLLIY